MQSWIFDKCIISQNYSAVGGDISNGSCLIVFVVVVVSGSLSLNCLLFGPPTSRKTASGEHHMRSASPGALWLWWATIHRDPPHTQPGLSRYSPVSIMYMYMYMYIYNVYVDMYIYIYIYIYIYVCACIRYDTQPVPYIYDTTYDSHIYIFTCSFMEFYLLATFKVT